MPCSTWFIDEIPTRRARPEQSSLHQQRRQAGYARSPKRTFHAAHSENAPVHTRRQAPGNVSAARLRLAGPARQPHYMRHAPQISPLGPYSALSPHILTSHGSSRTLRKRVPGKKIRKTGSSLPAGTCLNVKKPTGPLFSAVATGSFASTSAAQRGTHLASRRWIRTAVLDKARRKRQHCL